MSRRPDVEAQITFLDGRPRRRLATVLAAACVAAAAVLALTSEPEQPPPVETYQRETWIPTPSAAELQRAASEPDR